MGVGAQKDLEWRQTFARKAIGFSVPIKVTSKKKKKVFTEIETVFLSELR